MLGVRPLKSRVLPFSGGPRLFFLATGKPGSRHAALFLPLGHAAGIIQHIRTVTQLFIRFA
jgi:hypothetical protein